MSCPSALVRSGDFAPVRLSSVRGGRLVVVNASTVDAGVASNVKAHVSRPSGKFRLGLPSKGRMSEDTMQLLAVSVCVEITSIYFCYAPFIAPVANETFLVCRGVGVAHHLVARFSRDTGSGIPDPWGNKTAIFRRKSMVGNLCRR